MSDYIRCFARVNLSNIRHNISKIRNRISSRTKIMAVVKADAYGHGMNEVSLSICEMVDEFAVATIDEALGLRKAGIKKPVLILGTLFEENFEDAINNDIYVNVYTLEMAKALSDVCVKMGKNAGIHISVDTGMHRIGTGCDAAGLETVCSIASLPRLEIHGVFSHYATADEADKTASEKQAGKFSRFCTELEKRGVNTANLHIDNSAAVCDSFDSIGTIVRPGIIIYGLYPSDDVAHDLDLKPAMELKSHISYVKKLPAGCHISYGGTYVTDSERIIATVPVGYADGYPRKLSNCGRVIVNGCYAPIVGRVCMDQFMIDVTDVPDAKIGDIVTLMGTDGDCTVSCDEIAALCGTINYEIVCGISKRVPRMY